MSINSHVSRETLLKRVFSDTKNYPYGFSRSGDFSIAESKALAAHGALIAALVDGVLPPENQSDKDLIAIAHGAMEPQDTAQRAWVKYQKRINRPKAGSIYGTKKATREEKDDDLVSDLDDDMDIDIDSD